ncbi:hypothetical protein QYF36_024572 [Acer negundo]|nr:hypothetical protein QYF36_024572 [Acer negundo]
MERARWIVHAIEEPGGPRCHGHHVIRTIIINDLQWRHRDLLAADARKTAAVVVGMVVLRERLIEIGAVAGEIRDVAHGEIEAAAGEFGDAALGEIGAVDGEMGTKTVFALELFPLFP